MTTLQSKTYIGDQSYSVAECLKNMKGAFGELEAVKWAFLIKTAFLEFGYNPDIDNAMNDILSSKNVPLIVAKAEVRPDGDWGMPPVLINMIFKTGFNQKQLKYLWRWIKEYLIDKISYPYQYLSLLLFLECHHTSFLQIQHISNTDMQDQMRAWFPEVKVKCSADSLGTYRNGYIDSDKFNYVSWLSSNGEPIGSKYKKDQSLTGFQTLIKLCNDLEINFSELNI